MQRGWWELKIDMFDDNAEYNEIDLEHIAEMIKDGYKSGEIINYDDEDYNYGNNDEISIHSMPDSYYT